MGGDAVELREIRVFLVLAEELHFGRTADRLGLTAPRVSQTVATLERRVGGRLFERTSRRVTLTEREIRMRDDVAEPYAALLAAVGGVGAMDAELHGDLRVGLLGPATSGPRLLDVVARFEERHPRCRVRLVELAIGAGVEPLRQGEVDLLASWAARGAPDLVLGPVLQVDERVLVVAADHPLARHEELSVEVLGDHPVAECAGMTVETQGLIIPWRTPTGRPVVRSIRVASMGEVWAAVARGEIVHLTVAAMRDFSTHPGLAYVPVPDAGTLPHALTWSATTDDPRVRAFAAVAEEVVAAPARA